MTQRSRSWLLAVSLVINVFLIGGIVGGAYMAGLKRPAAAQGGLQLAAQGLAPELRKAFRQMLAQTRRGAAAETGAARTGRAELANLLTADALDRSAIDARLAAIRTADGVLRESIERAVIDFAETLTLAERRTFVEGLRGRSSMLRRVDQQRN